MSNPIRIHRFAKSGHSHRVELFASLAGIRHELVDVDLAGGAHKQPSFLRLSPLGQVPALEDGATRLADSNAILVYLARKYAPAWLPADPVEEARVQRFLSIAAGEIAFGPAAARLVTVFGAKIDADAAKALAVEILSHLEAHLEGRTYLVTDRATIADVALYTYVAHAPEGGVSLAPYPRVRAWLEAVRALPGFVPMSATAVGLAA